MNEESAFRGRCWVVLLLLALVMGASGCSSRLDKMQRRLKGLGDAQLARVVAENLAAGGGIEAWGDTGRLEGMALATVLDEQVRGSLIEQEHTFFPGARPGMSVVSMESEGRLLEKLDRAGMVRMELLGDVEGVLVEDEEQLRGAGLKLLLHGQAVTGGAGLLRKDVELRYAGQERKGGRLHHKIEMRGDMVRTMREGLEDADEELLVAWVDAQTLLIDRIWLRYRRTGQEEYGYLAANVSGYEKIGNGLILPHRIEFVRSDEYQQFSQRLILRIEYLRLEAYEKSGEDRPLRTLPKRFLAGVKDVWEALPLWKR